MNRKPFYTWVPWTEDFEGHDSLEAATQYANEYGDHGPRYVLESKFIFEKPEPIPETELRGLIHQLQRSS